MPPVCLDHAIPLLRQPPGRNDCGPYATAMAMAFYRPSAGNASLIAHELRHWRIPVIRATLPWGVRHVLAAHGFKVTGGWFGRVEPLKAAIRLNRPVIVLVKPSDFPRCPWYALHYRVVAGYRDEPNLPGGGELYFTCSATPPNPDRVEPGNLSVSYDRFARQWRTYLTYNWALALAE